MDLGLNEFRLDLLEYMQANHDVEHTRIEGLTRVDFDNEADVENYPILTFCYDMLADNMGNLWVLTRNNGIVHLSTKPSPFRFFHLNPAGQELPVNRIQSIFTHDGHRFWLGLQPYGLALYDRDTNHVLYNKDIAGFSAMIGADPIHVQTISAFQELPDHTLWIASSRGIIICRDGEQARLLREIRPGGRSTFPTVI